MNRVVADGTVLIHFAKLGTLDRLDGCFDVIFVPPIVYEEVVEQGRNEGYTDAITVDEATGSFLNIRDLSADASDRAAEIQDTANLGAGAGAAIALAEETDARCLTDDHAARQTAMEPMTILVDRVPDRYSPDRNAANSINRSVDQYKPRRREC